MALKVAEVVENVEEDEVYISEEDSDFAPDAVAAAPDSSDSEGDDVETEAKAKGSSKRKRHDNDAEDVGYENSGDEAIIGKGLKRRKKNAKAVEDDEGGGGGFVRTRAMKAIAVEQEIRKTATTEGATIDVEALWASMTSAPLKTSESARPTEDKVVDSDVEATPAEASVEDEPKMIMIQRTYNFAGKVQSESKLVSRHSAEAKLYLASQIAKTAGSPGNGRTPAIEVSSIPLRRPTARRSVFEPANEPLPPRTDLRFKVGAYVPRISSNDGANAKKLNTVEKSKMDWAGFVDKEGIKDDLETAAKSKGTYLDNQDFLTRADIRREEDSRRARLQGVV